MSDPNGRPLGPKGYSSPVGDAPCLLEASRTARWQTPGKNAALSGRRSRDTRPELLIRQALFSRGLRYRVNYPVPGASRRTVDIAFPRRRIAVFVDGCYWHGCPVHFRSPRTNTGFWLGKISGIRDRDSETNARLREAGWVVLRFWEHQDSDQAASVISAAVEKSLEMALGEAH